jgi:hypothetical protein
MSGTYTGNAANNPASITIPSDGDTIDATSVNAAFEGLADQVAWTEAGLATESSDRADGDSDLAADLATLDGEVANVKPLSAQSSIIIPFYECMRWVNSADVALVPGGVALAAAQLVTNTEIDASNGGGGTYSARVKIVNTTPNLGRIFSCPITKYLVPFQGRTIDNVVFRIYAPGGHGALPTKKFSVNVTRTNPAPTQLRQSLNSAVAFQEDASGSVAVYEAAHDNTFTCNQYNVIDTTTYAYELLFANEGGANALLGCLLVHGTINFA